MAAVSFRSFKATQFEQYAKQVQDQGTEIPRADAEKVAQHFKVPLEQVLALRDKVMAQSNKLTDAAGQKSADMREMGQGGYQPLGTAQIKGVGVNRFMFTDPDKMQAKVDDSLARESDKVPDFLIVARYGIMPPPGPEDGKKAMGEYLVSKKPIKGDPAAKNAVRTMDRAAGKLYQLMDMVADARKTGADLSRLDKSVVQDAVYDKLMAIEDPAKRDVAFGQRPVADLDNIGDKISARLNDLGIKTIADFIEADPAMIERELKAGTGKTDQEILDSMINPKPVLETWHKVHDARRYWTVADKDFDKETIEGAIKMLRNTYSRNEKLANSDEPVHQAVIDAQMNFLTANTHFQRSTFTQAMGDGKDPATMAAISELKAISRNIANLEFKAEADPEPPTQHQRSWWGQCNQKLADTLKELAAQIGKYAPEGSFTGARYDD